MPNDYLKYGTVRAHLHICPNYRGSGVKGPNSGLGQPIDQNFGFGHKGIEGTLQSFLGSAWKFYAPVTCLKAGYKIWSPSFNYGQDI
jgi:hypothetical protein